MYIVYPLGLSMSLLLGDIQGLVIGQKGTWCLIFLGFRQIMLCFDWLVGKSLLSELPRDYQKDLPQDYRKGLPQDYRNESPQDYWMGSP